MSRTARLVSLATLLAAACDGVAIPTLRPGPAAPRSCADAALDGGAPGPVVLDPDGPGGGEPFPAVCEQAADGPWTRVALDDFDQPGAPGYSVSTVSTCGTFGAILGGPAVLGNATVSKRFDLRGVRHTQVRVRFELVVIDSWDGEVAFADLDGARVWQIRCSRTLPATCGQNSEQCGSDLGVERMEGKVPVDVTIAHDATTVELVVGAVLDQTTTDESWGLDNVSVWVR